MDDASEIMAPDLEISIRGGAEKVVVKELNWKAIKGFLRGLTAHTSEFMTIDGRGKAQVDTNKLMGVLLANLGEELVMATTGKPQEGVDNLDPVSLMSVFTTAAQLNVRPEMIDMAKNAVGLFRTLMPAKGTSQTPTTT